MATLGAMIAAFAGMNVFYYVPRALFGSSLFIVIAAIGLAFIAFTFFPPRLLPWLDVAAGGYGIM